MKIDLILSIFYQPPEMLKDYIKHSKHLYVPMNSGNLKGTDAWCDKHLRYETDFKDNIAHLNPKLNEMSLIWCYWKNLMKNADYVGFNHYRRMFATSDFKDLADYDIVDAKPIAMLFNMSFFTGDPKPNLVTTDIKNGYAICHEIDDWNKMEEILKKTPFYVDFEEWKMQNCLSSPCNMFIMKKKIFEEYCEFIFPILFELEKQVDLTGRSDYQGRALAFLSERLTSLFLFVKKQQGYKFKTIDTLFFEGWRPNGVDNRDTFTRWVK